MRGQLGPWLGAALLTLIAANYLFFQDMMDPYQAMLQDMYKTNNEYSVGGGRSSSSSSNSDHATSYQKRMSYYRNRYNYHPAESKFYNNQSAISAVSGKVGGENASSLCGIPPAYDKWFSRDYKGRSANQEDKTIYQHFFKDIGPQFRGTFVEMGAFDGIEESNSLFFETCAGWDGILIEANPTVYYKRLVGNRPHAHRFHFAPSCNQTEEDNNATLQFYPTHWTNAGVAADNVKSSYTNNWDQELATVPCGTLTDILLDILPGGRVNFFSLDVEGAEPMVVGKAIDFKRVFIEVLMVEQFNNHCPAPPGQCKSR